jgi:hypothetical protein
MEMGPFWQSRRPSGEGAPTRHPDRKRPGSAASIVIYDRFCSLIAACVQTGFFADEEHTIAARTVA